MLFRLNFSALQHSLRSLWRDFLFSMTFQFLSSKDENKHGFFQFERKVADTERNQVQARWGNDH